MKQLLIVLISISISALTPLLVYAKKTCRNDTCCLTPLRTGIHYRSQGANTARELVGWQNELHKPEMCEFYGANYIAFEYTRSFNSCAIARALFGSDTLKFAGSLVKNRRSDELVADNFGLDRHFRGKIKFRPRIENFIFDFGFYLGLDQWVQNLYLRIHAPVVHTRWSLNSCTDCKSKKRCFEGKRFPFCYVDSSPTHDNAKQDGTQSLSEPTQLSHNKSAGSIQEALSGDFEFGDMQTPWRSGHFDCCRRIRNGLADIDLILGYDFINNDCYHFGAYLQAVLPTGRKTRSEFIFDPVVGNGGHFELGAGLSAHSILWAGEDYNLAVYFEGNVTHLFRSRQCRLFDLLRNGHFSRYLLLKEFNSDGTKLSYNGNLYSATEFATRAANVRISVKGDASIKLAWRWCGFSFDLGYNIYGHSHEKVSLRCDAHCDLDTRKFGIKGTESVCCESWSVANVNGAPSVFLPGTAYPESAVAPTGCPTLKPIAIEKTKINNNTQANTTAFTVVPRDTQVYIPMDSCTVCLNFDDRAAFEAAVRNNPDFENGIPLALLPQLPGVRVSNISRTQLLSDARAALNIRSAEAPSYLTHKIFMHLNYIWDDPCGWNPHVGIGGEVEFNGRLKHCTRFGVEQWGVWVKGGISF